MALRKGLEYIHNVMKEHGLKHWVSYGTLLGGIRNGDIIDWDNDIDFEGFFSDLDQYIALNDIIKKEGYEFSVDKRKKCRDFSTPFMASFTKSKYEKWPVNIKILYDGTSIGDVFLFTCFADGILRRFDPRNKLFFNPKTSFPYWYVEELEEVIINNKPYPCPRHPEKILEYHYGPDWRTPINCLEAGAKKRRGYNRSGTPYYSDYKKLIEFSHENGAPIQRPDLPAWPTEIRYISSKKGLIWLKKNHPEIFGFQKSLKKGQHTKH